MVFNNIDIWFVYNLKYHLFPFVIKYMLIFHQEIAYKLLIK